MKKAKKWLEMAEPVLKVAYQLLKIYLAIEDNGH